MVMITIVHSNYFTNIRRKIMVMITVIHRNYFMNNVS